jgi:hypothetical protein
MSWLQNEYRRQLYNNHNINTDICEWSIQIEYHYSMRRVLPALVLFLLAPVCGELLSSSAPPVEFFNPLTFITLCLLYGGGAVLVRELAFRWRKGWVSILILGAAYGIIEEGLMVKSFFDPGWVDIGILGSYGRWLGVNWVWAVELMIYHAVISIGIPILITTLLFPSRKESAWVGKRFLTWIFVFFLLDVAFGFLALTTYRPPLVPYLVAIGMTVGLILFSKRNREPLPVPTDKPVISRFKFGLAAFILTILFFMTAWVLPNFGLPPILPILLFGLIVWAAGLWIWRMSGSGNWRPPQLAALASGALLFFIILAPLVEMDKTRMDDPSGMTLVGLVALILLVLFNRHMQKQGRLEVIAN